MFKTKRFITGLLFIALLFAVLPGITGASASTLPPRPEPPTSTPSAIVTNSNSGSFIELRVPTASLNYFTVVQWQSAVDHFWHNVDTWQGNLDDVYSGSPTLAYKRWWVYASDFGQQNFRWQVFNHPHGQLLVTSDTFNLPANSKQAVISQVTLP